MSIFIGDRTSDHYSRLLVNEVKFDETVCALRQNVSDLIKISKEKIELIYCGRQLKDSEPLQSYGIKEGVTVHALRKIQIPEEEASVKMSEDEIRQTVIALRQAIMLHPGDRRMTNLTNLVTSSESRESIMAATPGLAKDPVAIAMLQSPQLLGVLADPTTISKVLDEHPSLGPAAMHIAAALNEEAAKGGVHSRSTENSGGTYSLDQMSDDDEYDAPLSQQMSGEPSGGITASQLAAALAAATGSQTSGTQQSMITADFFQQAMQQALSGSSSSSPSPSQPQQLTRENLQNQLQQLQDIGITDEAAALQALQATGGNVQLALSILFGDNL